MYNYFHLLLDYGIFFFRSAQGIEFYNININMSSNVHVRQKIAPQQSNYKPLVSVIMPVYKQEQFMLRAINSLLAQTLTEWELIIINDGSPGNVSTIIDSINDSRIVYFQHIINKGLVAALN